MKYVIIAPTFQLRKRGLREASLAQNQGLQSGGTQMLVKGDPCPHQSRRGWLLLHLNVPTMSQHSPTPAPQPPGASGKCLVCVSGPACTGEHTALGSMTVFLFIAWVKNVLAFSSDPFGSQQIFIFRGRDERHLARTGERPTRLSSADAPGPGKQGVRAALHDHCPAAGTPQH